ncbi:MAG: sigma 54-interacting transcriptional regulator [Myxococcales bacterium]|nr:sigma 54-interacting transcriptional regulator [Myxococcales bacterium]MDD9968401.1 sigma 54-interacting transcriptional regulator [Myxococcales bacterium]
MDDGETYARVVEEQLPEVELVRPGARTRRLKDGKAAIAFLEEHPDAVDLVLLDMHFDLPEARLLPVPGVQSLRRKRRYQGVAILHAIRRFLPDLPIVLLTSQEDLSLLDADGSLGAQSMTYFLDGDDLDALRISIHRAQSAAALGREEDGIFWGRDAQMVALRRRLAVLARGRLPVIIEGETGTGKSFLAERFVHRKSGRSGAFVVLDLSTVPRDLISAHLFGAVRGAYTGAVADRKGVFEAADGGTLFIDEIQNAPLEVQKQLLLVLQDGKFRRLGSTQDVPVDVKVLVASNTSLSAAVADGSFRADLYMRLSPATGVHVPPLRDRPGDLRFLAERFVAQAGEDADLRAMGHSLARAAGLPDDASLALTIGRGDEPPKDQLEISLAEPSWRRLCAYEWPGNLREMSMVLYNIVSFTLVGAVDAMHDGTPVRSARLQVDPGLVGELLGDAGARVDAEATLEEAGVRVALAPGRSLNAVAQAVERQYLTALFRQHGGDLGAIANVLLGDSERGRAVRLRFNQLGLSVRALRRG